jgi:hypothetical protein
MANHRVHPDRVLTAKERSQRCRDKRKKEAAHENQKLRHISTVINVRQAIVDMANHDELKTLYHSLAVRLHPDKPTGDQEQFKKLSRLWTRLTKEGSDTILRNEIGDVTDGILTKPANVAATNDKGVRVATKEEKDDISAAETPKATEPPQPAIVTPSTATPSELAREIEQQPQEQTAATCATCGRDVEMKDGRIGWHVNLGTFEDCTGGADFETMCRSISADVRSGTGLEAKQS